MIGALAIFSDDAENHIILNGRAVQDHAEIISRQIMRTAGGDKNSLIGYEAHGGTIDEVIGFFAIINIGSGFDDSRRIQNDHAVFRGVDGAGDP